jgi:hypothetical protein
MKAIAYVLIHPAGAKVKRVLKKVHSVDCTGAEIDHESLLQHSEPSEARIKSMEKGGWQFCNWHVVEVAEKAFPKI